MIDFILSMLAFAMALGVTWLIDWLLWGGVYHQALPFLNRMKDYRQKLSDAVQPRLAPISSRWAQITAPVTTRWAAFKTANPRLATAVQWMKNGLRAGFALLMFLIFGVWFGLFGRLPSTDELREIETANSTEIYTADSVLIGKYFIENRTAVTLDKVSPYIINALIATEDKRFLEHSGIDIMSYFRVFYGIAAGQKQRGGGSTLSQQLAKNLYPRKDYLAIKTEKRTYKIPVVSNVISLLINKIRENFISIKLEKVYTKQQLLGLYLNTVPFGENAFGINVASRQFFGKKPNDLTVDQASTLVGMLKGTTLYNPLRNPENAKKRRNVVMLQMVKNNHLSQAEYDELSKKPVGAKRYDVDNNNEGTGTYFREYLRTDVMPKLLKDLKNEDGKPYNLYTDGLKIYTTLNAKMQQFAEESVLTQMEKLQKQFDQHWKNVKGEKPWGDDKWIDKQVEGSQRWQSLKEAGMSDEDARKAFEQPVKMNIYVWKNGGSERDTMLSPLDSVRYYFCMLNCGFMAMDHHNGYIKAWVGGINFKNFKLDHNLTKRQVGSTFKPIVYAAALQDTIKPCSYFPNEIRKIVDWEPHNADETYGGWYSMTGALTRSVNVVTAQLIEKVGIQKTIDLAQKMGITATLPREYGISLGAADISLYDMMKVYGTMANAGKRPDPVAVLTVVDRRGKVIYDRQKSLTENPALQTPVEALTEDQAATMTKMLQNVVDYGTGARLRSYVRGDFAGKTGTTQNHSDGWFICYNPQLVTGAWVGGESPAVRFRIMALGQGSAMALPIVGGFWNRIASDKKLNKMLLEKFPTPKPEVLNLLGCQSWISVAPDSFQLIMQQAGQDSLLRDSLMELYTNRKNLPPPGGEAPADPDDKKEDEEKGEKKKEGIIERLLFRKKKKDE
ncbi:MAG TPA: transglycosylase domain-containing protein [Saprospiraceae bacterium]|nr:transglycosylase domain-containing protein [Saprospiraceae bacterium]